LDHRPRFSDPANYDYHLRPNSPAIGAGVDGSVKPEFEYVHPVDGKQTSGKIDAGAYQSNR
jgi:hypothetical protein